MSDDLWAEASADHDKIAREAALARAEAALEEVLPFLLGARSEQEYIHRRFMALGSLSEVAARSGVPVEDVIETADRRFQLCRQALMEGTDPLETLEHLLNGAPGAPEKPVEHSQGPDFSGGYSEVPQGPLDGPDPRVTAPRPPMTGPVQEAAGSLRREAAAGRPSADPVRRKVMQVTALIRRANPDLHERECERLGRVVVGRYLRTADLDDSVMNNGPVETGGGSGSGEGHSGGGAVQHMLEGQGLRSMIPGLGGGAGAGEAAGAGAELAEAAPLLAL